MPTPNLVQTDRGYVRRPPGAVLGKSAPVASTGTQRFFGERDAMTSTVLDRARTSTEEIATSSNLGSDAQRIGRAAPM